MAKTMRVFTGAFALTLMLAIMTVPALAKGGHDKATGGVDWTDGSGRTYHASFNAHDDAPGPKGTTVDRGNLTLTREGATVTVDLDCVRVEGNEAWFGGDVVDYRGGDADWGNTQSFDVGDNIQMWVQDNGEPGRDDLIGRTWNANLTCEDDWSGQGTVDSGNLQVHSGS